MLEPRNKPDCSVSAVHTAAYKGLILEINQEAKKYHQPKSATSEAYKTK